jgi:U3 small nucleolar RNA-associated protein 14
MKKRADATYEETRLDYEELEESLRKLEDDNTEENVDSIKVTGKRTFGPVKRAHEEANKRAKLGDADKNSDSGDDSDRGQHFDSSEENKADYANNKADDVQLGTALLDDEQQNDLLIVRSSNLCTVAISCVFNCKNLIYNLYIM